MRSALAFLRKEYRIGNEAGETPYVLYGHSCGTTLALQVVMGFDCGPSKDEVPVPTAIVGFQGMYDLVGLNKRFKGAYREMIAGALGDDEEVWKTVSPAWHSRRFSETWSEVERGLITLAYSPEDEWVDMAEIDAMEDRLKKDGAEAVHVQAKRDLKGGHDAVAESGRTVATVLVETIVGLDNLERVWKVMGETLQGRFPTGGL